VGAARSAIRFEPPKLTSIGGGRISRSTAEVGALAEAREQGRAEALAELDATIERHRRATEDMQAASRALVDALHQIQRADVDRIHDLERQVLELGLAVAEEIVGREVAADRHVVLTSAERALALAPDRGPVVLRVHPADVAAVRDALRPDAAAGSSIGAHLANPVQVVADPSVERAGVVADVGPLRLDAQVGSAIARIRDAFRV
jgi:flagellar assembly protein FliH